MIRNQNPVFQTIATGTTHYEDVDAASYKGIVIKTGILLLVTVVVAVLTALGLPYMLVNNAMGLYVALVISAIVGFIAVIAATFTSKSIRYFRWIRKRSYC